MEISTKRLNLFCDPFPVKLPKCNWIGNLQTLKQVSKLKSCWLIEGKTWTFNKIKKVLLSKKIPKEIEPARYYIIRMAKDNVKPNPIIVINNIVFDGNHTLLSLMVRNYKGLVLVFNNIRRKK